MLNLAEDLILRHIFERTPSLDQTMVTYWIHIGVIGTSPKKLKMLRVEPTADPGGTIAICSPSNSA